MTASGSRMALMVALLVPIGPAFSQDTADTRRAAALRYANVAPLSRLLEDSVSEMAKQMPQDERARMMESMRAGLGVEHLEKAAIEAMVKTFTTQELDALADFYGSPVGKSALSKFGIYLGELFAALVQQPKTK